jgi:hypothetical protein
MLPSHRIWGAAFAAWCVLGLCRHREGGVVIRSQVAFWVMLPGVRASLDPAFRTTQTGPARHAKFLAPFQGYPIPRKTEILNERGRISALLCRLHSSYIIHMRLYFFRIRKVVAYDNIIQSKQPGNSRIHHTPSNRKRGWWVGPIASGPYKSHDCKCNARGELGSLLKNNFLLDLR